MLVVVILLVGRALILWLLAVVGSTWLMGARADVGDAALFVEGGGVVVPEEGWTRQGRGRWRGKVGCRQDTLSSPV
jgi:hypothetical protein